MVSARPTEDFEGSVTVLYEPGDDEREVRLVTSGALSENVRGRPGDYGSQHRWLCAQYHSQPR